MYVTFLTGTKCEDLIEHADYEDARNRWLLSLLTSEPRTIGYREGAFAPTYHLDAQWVIDNPKCFLVPAWRVAS